MTYKLIGLILLASVSHSFCRNFNDDFTPTPTELDLLNQVKVRMADVTRFDDKSYFQSDAFLMRWLRVNQFDVVKTQEKLMQFLKWRTENEFDNWIADPWIEKTYPIQIFQDKEGMPVIWFEFTKFNIRDSVRNGMVDKYKQHFMKWFDKANEMLYSLRETGSNITRISALTNLQGFNYQDHLCPFCIPTYLELVIQLESYYPQTLDKVVGINIPPLFDPLLALARPLMGEQLQKSLQLYTVQTKSSTWKDYLEDWVGLENIPTPNHLL